MIFNLENMVECLSCISAYFLIVFGIAETVIRMCLRLDRGVPHLNRAQVAFVFATLIAVYWLMIHPYFV